LIEFDLPIKIKRIPNGREVYWLQKMNIDPNSSAGQSFIFMAREIGLQEVPEYEAECMLARIQYQERLSAILFQSHGNFHKFYQRTA